MLARQVDALERQLKSVRARLLAARSNAYEVEVEDEEAAAGDSRRLWTGMGRPAKSYGKGKGKDQGSSTEAATGEPLPSSRPRGSAGHVSSAGDAGVTTATMSMRLPRAEP
jgi:hypothetical protein